MSDVDIKAEFWKSFIRAVEADPKEPRPLRGASGLIHPVIALGLDEKRRRLVIISGEPDARTAAMAQADIQATMPFMNVIFGRPAPINLAIIAQVVLETFGSLNLGQSDIQKLGELFQDKKFAESFAERVFKPIIQAFQFASLNLVASWMEVIKQLSFIELETISEKSPDEKPKVYNILSKGQTIRLGKLIALDPVEIDRQLGICSVPLYDLSPEEAEVFHSGSDIEHVREILKLHNIFQYFFPAPDQLTLGLVEAQKISVDELLGQLTEVPKIGHPFGKPEIISPTANLPNVIEGLQERGLIVEGEVGLELTPTGATSRAVVRFKPREGLLSKIANIISVKIGLNIKDLFK